MGTKDPGTTSSDGLKIKVALPKEKLENIELDVTSEFVHLSTPNFVVKEQLPRPVDSKTAKAKWDSSKSTLEIRCRVQPGEYDFLRQ